MFYVPGQYLPIVYMNKQFSFRGFILVLSEGAYTLVDKKLLFLIVQLLD
jgi:hypothetical protein